MNPTTEMNLDDLRRIMAECAGEEEGIDLTGDIRDTAFIDLGYDSLALMESAARIKREFGVAIADDDLAQLETPRAVLDVVNRALAVPR